MARFDQKSVLITGGGSGIGLAAAKTFSREGAILTIVDLDAHKAHAAVAEIVEQGGRATAFAADASDAAQCEAMVAHAMNAYGGLHIAFNNAGMPTVIGGEFEDFSVKAWDRVMAVNAGGIFMSMRAEATALKRSGGTAIVNTASVASFIAAPGMAAYVASKHAVAGLTKAAALDFIGYGIRVNAVCPGFVDTPMLGSATSAPEGRSSIEMGVPIKRMAQPHEIAETVLFLASEQASYLVGSLVRADGGVSLP